MSDERKRVGACTVCDREVFACEARWKVGPLAGDIRTVGMPEEGVKRAWVVRASGRVTPWTLCASCDVTPDQVARIHHKEMAAFSIEQRCYEDHSDPMMDLCFPFDPKQHDQRDLAYRMFAFDIPIGVLFTAPWWEVY